MKQTIETLSELAEISRTSRAIHFPTSYFEDHTVKRLPLSLVLRTLLLITLLFVQVVSVFAQGQGSVGRALRFDGVDDYVEVSHVQAYGNVQSEAFTIRAHFVINALTPEKSQVIIRKSHGQQWYS